MGVGLEQHSEGVRVQNVLVMSEFAGAFTGADLHVKVSICINALS